MLSRHFFNNTERGGALLAIALIGLGLVACGNDEAGAGSTSPAAAQARVAPALPVTVSGVSSGAYMAVQAHVALSDRIAGAGLVAGGPYHCAQGSIARALGPCMKGEDLDVEPLLAFAREASATGRIADIQNLRASRVWIFNSPGDAVVSQKVAEGLVGFYRQLVPGDAVRYVNDVQAAHGWPTPNYGGPCFEMGGDFINACDYDTAGALLNELIDGLAEAGDASAGTLSSVDLSSYFPAGSEVAETGFVFVPEACMESMADCRLHIAFHGCRQGAEFVGDRFAANVGLNEWAATNRMVVVYPQVEKSLTNPQGCWDWWGYTGEDYDLAAGKQVAGIDALISAFARDRLTAGSER